ncbi:helix-turn-helix domain-containing protein [Nocardia donostiensis]|uniref:Transcriptional regulator n=1 Tax=Nocardia donostiensis TaxID=1538463 RepID=A0A1V2TG86_9NOCA|nr:helix-turn-helix transcriptional regulator [Nocardia donostiensis]ONM48468.1 transcriptional regulator [Nocardia donostiensis]OQS18615.1 transcriptional regulator [Nocardia donostiensis]
MTGTPAGSTVPRRQLGRHLRELRTAAGYTIATAAEMIQWSPSMLQRVEKGNMDKVRDVDVRELCRIYDAEPELVEALIGLARQANTEEWWHSYGDLIPENFDVYVGLETVATSLTAYQSELVPGLLQTADYARTLIRTGYPNGTDAEIERRVQLRVKRQALLKRSIRPVRYDAVLQEAVLRRVIGSSAIMKAQIKALADASTRPNVNIRVLPFSAGYPTGDLIGSFTILRFDSGGKGQAAEPPVVYMEGFTGALYVDKPSTVERYGNAHYAIQSAALGDQESRSLLRKLAKEYV